MRRQLLLCVTSSLIGLTTLGGAQAGFFDLLFGPPSPRPSAALPEYIPDDSPFAPFVSSDDMRRRAAAKKAADAARRAAAQRRSAEQAAQDKRLVEQLSQVAADHGAQAAFMLDPTLRQGDVVVTQSGMRVFEGKSATVHAVADFQPLRGSLLKARSELVAMQAVSGLNAPQSKIVIARTPRPLTISRQSAVAARAGASVGSGDTGSPASIMRSAAGSDGGQ
jgi:hypothetical protein